MRGPRDHTLSRAGILAALILLVVALVPAAQAQAPAQAWQAAGAPTAFVSHLALDPISPDFLILFLAQAVERNNDRTRTVQGALKRTWAPYISSDGGETWQPASSDLAHVQPTVLTALAYNGQSTLWVGTAAQGLWRSNNGGRTWRPVLVRDMGDERVVAFVQDRRQRLHMLTVDNTRYPSSHLYTSDDNGNNWFHRILQSYTGEPATTMLDLLADPFEANRLYAVGMGTIFVSEDAGFSWRRSPVPLPRATAAAGASVMVADPTQRGRLYLVQRSHQGGGRFAMDVYRSSDGGLSWERLPARFISDGTRADYTFHPLRLRLDPFNRRRLLLATDAGLWVSDDAGVEWHLAGSVLGGVSVEDVVLHPRQRDVWFANTAAGLFRTTTAGSGWRALRAGLPPTARLRSLVALSPASDVLLALNDGVEPLEHGAPPLWRSTDGGETWSPAMLGLGGLFLQRLVSHPAQPDLAYALAANGIARTTNAGRSWQFMPLAFNVSDLAAGARSDSLYAAGFDGILRSTDGGETWQPTALTGAAQAVAVDAAERVVAIAEQTRGERRVWRSHDEGATWEPLGIPPAGNINQLVAHPLQADVLALSLYWGGLYVSRDGGRTWSRSDAGIPAGVHWRGSSPEVPAGPNLLAVYIDPVEPEQWWAGRDGGGVYHSADGGRSWRDAAEDLGDNLVTAFARSKSGLVSGTEGLGVLRLQASATDQIPPADVDVRIEILWPHDFAPVTEARLANLGLRVYAGRSMEPPPCAWMPPVELWVAEDAGPLRRLGLAQQRTVEGHSFPFWEFNDVDVTWANDPNHKLVFLAKVPAGLATSHSSLWIHAADARTLLPEPPEPAGLTTEAPEAIDALIRVVWPHDEQGRFVPPDQANLVNISAILVARDTLLALAPEHLPPRVWLIGALDNQVGRRLAVGEPRRVDTGAFAYTTYEFNNIDVSLARDPAHRWAFWLETPDVESASNVWIHGIDGRTIAPELLEPVVGCRP
ncbi:MAG: hypothetical protein D6775_06565 [Caldilineae bacterium]|nr:MAG: hypothetical protein D6775_06565 [Caldilineae bacterium]